MRHVLSTVFLCLSALPAPAQTGVDPEHLLAQLGRSAAAREQLVALGGRAVPALIRWLDVPDPGTLAEVLAVLHEIGPDAGAAVGPLKALVSARANSAPLILWTLAELAPYRAAEVRLDPSSFHLEILKLLFTRRTLEEGEAQLALQRLRVRVSIPADAGVETLIAAASGFQAFRIELAVELLGRRGAAAAAALPALHAVLDRPDPRILSTERTVPLRAKAARAILAIAAEGPAAERARAVLAHLDDPAAGGPAMPERARARIAELIQELADAAKRPAAAANLTALGRLAVPALADALAAGRDDAFVAAGLSVLQELGPRAVAAMPRLVELLPSLSTEHTLSLMHTLAAVAPWSRDVVPPLNWGASIGSLRVFGVLTRGEVDAAFLNEFNEVNQRYNAAIAVDPSSALSELEALLVDVDVYTREAAIAVLRERGAAARPVLRAVARVLEQDHLRYNDIHWFAKSACTEAKERTETVHRLAARAILAIAVPGDPLVATARQVLARSEAR